MLIGAELTKRYSDRTCLQQVSLEISPSEILAVIGQSGAGKSTLLRLLCGIETPDEGSITFEGADITLSPMFARARLGISYLAQGPTLFASLTVEQNIQLALETLDLSRLQRQRLCRKLLEDFGLDQLATSRAARLSGGERRKTELARTVATLPRYLLLDEPFSGIDPIGISDMRRIIQAIASSGVGILVVDHNVHALLDLCHRACILDSGTTIAQGTPAEMDALLRTNWESLPRTATDLLV